MTQLDHLRLSFLLESIIFFFSTFHPRKKSAIGLLTTEDIGKSILGIFGFKLLLKKISFFIAYQHVSHKEHRIFPMS